MSTCQVEFRPPNAAESGRASNAIDIPPLQGGSQRVAVLVERTVVAIIRRGEHNKKYLAKNADSTFLDD